MVRIIKTEFLKLKRYSIIWIGIAATLIGVLLTRFMAIATDGTRHTLSQFSENVIWNNFSLIFPATIVLIAGYLVERERTDNTLKNINVIPISFRKLLLGKICVMVFICILLSVVEFIFTLIVVCLSKYPILSVMDVFRCLYQMTGMNLLVFVAVLPIILFTCQKSGGFMKGVIFAFFYGFVGLFAASHNLVNFYPVTAGLGLINYQGEEGMEYNKGIEFMVILLLFLISAFLITKAKDRVKQVKK